MRITAICIVMLSTGLFANNPLAKVKKKISDDVSVAIEDALYNGVIKATFTHLYDVIKNANAQDRGKVALAVMNLVGMKFDDVQTSCQEGLDMISDEIVSVLHNVIGDHEDGVVVKILKAVPFLLLQQNQMAMVAKNQAIQHKLTKTKSKLAAAKAELENLSPVKRALFPKKTQEIQHKIERLEDKIVSLKKGISHAGVPAQQLLMNVLARV